MNQQIVPITLLSLLTVAANLQAAGPDAGFSAYHTRMNPSPAGHIGKYEDLVVTLGKANRLEFARSNGYLPQWRTANGVHRIGNLRTKMTHRNAVFPIGSDPNHADNLRDFDLRTLRQVGEMIRSSR